MASSRNDVHSRLARSEYVLEISRTLNSTLDLPSLLELIIGAAQKLTGTEASSILLTDPKTGELYFEAVISTKREAVKRVVVPRESLAGWVAREGRAQVINDVSKDARFSPSTDRESGFKTRALIALPLQVKGRTIGVLEVVNRIDHSPFDEEDVHVLSSLAAHAAVAIANARLFQQSDLISEMVHELRTPLTSIVAYSELLMRDDLNPDQLRSFVTTINQEASRLTHMINDFLDLARLQSGRIRMAHQPVDVGELLRECCAVMQPQADQKNVRLEAEITGELPALKGDRNRLKQVLMNLLSNAIKYNRPEGRAIVEARDGDGCIELIIADTGRGIPEKDLPHIFDKFYRVADSEGWASGTGLGLSITREIVEAHGGRIEVESQVGAGTRFKLTLPLTHH
ncbi:MAG TPA: GAF domain-containing sensor histidine kinase, partial [Anaerolineae bacterium]|nr:GAF domain-containing sensor histidine kinase [Anaerolineae bacterium]